MSEPSDEAVRRGAALAAQPLISVTPPNGFFRGGLRSLNSLWKYRELLGLMVQRETKARYKDSYLGIIWSLIRPLIQLLVYYFAIGEILGAARNVPDFAIMLFTGLTLWSLFAEIVQSSTGSIINNSGLVKKIYLPREIFPLAATGSALVNFFFQTLILLGAVAVISNYRISLDLLMFPVAALIMVIFGTAFGFMLSAINVNMRDVQHFVEVAIMVLFWLSPIVYAFTFVTNSLQGSWVEQLYLTNPMTIAILGAQKALWTEGTLATGDLAQILPTDLWSRLFIALAVGVCLLWVGQRIFARLQGNFAQAL